MSFFARPNLDDIQFKQLTGSTLTMSGTTDFSGVLKSKGVEIDATATGATAGDALVFDGTKIVLTPISGGSSGMYYGNTPASITLGGISGGTTLTGKTLSKIIEELLVPAVHPSITPPSEFAFIITPSTSVYEVGTSILITAMSCFSSGSISPQYHGASSCRSGLPYSYNNTDFGVSQTPILSSSCSNLHSLAAHIITNGNNTLSATVTYLSGATPAYNSDGGVFATALPTGTTLPQSCIICGLFPYFYGKIASGGAPAGGNRPDPNTTIRNCIIALDLSRATGIIVADSTGAIDINWNSGSDDYIWFATPVASAIKVKWADTVVTVNNGSIGGAVSAGGNLFPNPASIVNISAVCWATPQTYNVYVSNYQTKSTNIMVLTNS
jgi:hypothetical protein